jgi:uncharacterized protein (DUF302 family)
MAGETAIISYSTPEPFESATKRVREALVREGFAVLAELDISRQIQRALGIELAQCTVLYVCFRQSFLEAVREHSKAGVLLPLHVVVSACRERSEIHMLAAVDRNGANPEPVLECVNRLQNEIAGVIDRIAMHRSYCQ